MATDCLQPPYLIFILKCDPVHLIRSILLQQTAQALHTFPCTVNIRKNNIYDILFADAASHFFFSIFCRLIHDERIRAEHTRIRCDRLRRGHADPCRIDTTRRPDALPFYRIGHRGVAHRMIWKFDLHMRNLGFIMGRLLRRMDDHKFLRGKAPRSRIIVPGNHRRAIIARLFADQYCCTCHFVFLLGSLIQSNLTFSIRVLLITEKPLLFLFFLIIISPVAPRNSFSILTKHAFSSCGRKVKRIFAIHPCSSADRS